MAKTWLKFAEFIIPTTINYFERNFLFFGEYSKRENARVLGLTQVKDSVEWIDSKLQQWLDYLDLAWDDFAVDFYAMDGLMV